MEAELWLEIRRLHLREKIPKKAVARRLSVDIKTVRRAIHIHPTLAEAVNAAAGGVHRPATD